MNIRFSIIKNGGNSMAAPKVGFVSLYNKEEK
jgi:hypothetical protein